MMNTNKTQTFVSTFEAALSAARELDHYCMENHIDFDSRSILSAFANAEGYGAGRMDDAHRAGRA